MAEAPTQSTDQLRTGLIPATSIHRTVQYSAEQPVPEGASPRARVERWADKERESRLLGCSLTPCEQHSKLSSCSAPYHFGIVGPVHGWAASNPCMLVERGVVIAEHSEPAHPGAWRPLPRQLCCAFWERPCAAFSRGIAGCGHTSHAPASRGCHSRPALMPLARGTRAATDLLGLPVVVVRSSPPLLRRRSFRPGPQRIWRAAPAACARALCAGRGRAWPSATTPAMPHNDGRGTDRPILRGLPVVSCDHLGCCHRSLAPSALPGTDRAAAAGATSPCAGQ